jgi:hypothetical protein
VSRTWLDDEPEKRWTLKDIYDDLGTSTDVAAILDVTIWRMKQWQQRQEKIHCPLPIRRLGNADIYSIQEWRDWYARWCADPKRERWVREAKPNGAGLPFFAVSGPDRGMSTRTTLKRLRAKEQTGE